MSDAAPPLQPADSLGDAPAGGALSPEAIDRILADFRVWLGDLAAIPAPAEPPSEVDLHALIGQFTALRHEINLQTRSARTSIEQSGEAIGELRSALEELRERPASEDSLDSLLKAVTDVYDNLALALRQVEKQRASIDESLDEWIAGADVPAVSEAVENRPQDVRPGFFRRLMGAQSVQTLRRPQDAAACKEIQARHQRTVHAAQLIRSSFDGLIAGYSMSLARVDRVFEQYELQSIATVGETFDPELMEVVEVIGDSGKPAGEVVEEVRRGYIRGDVVFRYAQVKVAR
jgi:molecular chaperone GrpE